MLIVNCSFPGSYDKCVAGLRSKHKDDMAAVTEAIFSHSQVSKKNQLVITLIVSWLTLIGPNSTSNWPLMSQSLSTQPLLKLACIETSLILKGPLVWKRPGGWWFTLNPRRVVNAEQDRECQGGPACPSDTHSSLPTPLWAEAQPGRIYIPVRDWHVRAWHLSRKLTG